MLTRYPAFGESKAFLLASTGKCIEKASNFDILKLAHALHTCAVSTQHVREHYFLLSI
jgi:hypothetical protein